MQLRRAFLAGLLASAIVFGCSPAGEIDRSAPAPNVLLIMIDTLRADHTSAYGYERETSPTLERLTSEGVRFEQAYSPTSTTGPSTVSLFTSRYPIAHRILRNGLPLNESFYTIAERLHDAGYQTYGISSSVPLSVSGFEQGFETYDAELPREESSPIPTEPAGGKGAGPNRPGQLVRKSPDGHVGYDRRPKFTSQRVLDWFSNQRDATRPYFAYIHYIDPHEPYTPNEEQLAHFPPPDQSLPLAEYNLASYVRDYDAETLYTDTEIGRVLDFLQTNGELDNTLVVVVADHGQGLYQHGHPSHGRQLYEEVVHIPWIMVWPARIPAGRVIKPPVSLLDVMPTIFEYLGVSLNHDEIHGRSLVSLVDGESEPDFEYRIYLQRQYQPPGPNRRPKGWQSERLFAVRSGQWKYIEGPDSGVRELYDLDVDPGETENLASKNRSTVEMLSGYLADWRREYATTGDEDDPAISPEVKEGLKALGYVD